MKPATKEEFLNDLSLQARTLIQAYRQGSLNGDLFRVCILRVLEKAYEQGAKSEKPGNP